MGEGGIFPTSPNIGKGDENMFMKVDPPMLDAPSYQYLDCFLDDSSTKFYT